VTIVKLSASLKQFYCQEGELEENEYRKDRCRTQIKLKLNSPVNYFLTAPLGNHHLICYGNHKKELGDYYRSLGLDDISE
jgi:L-fucose isomerase-like protein